jgi:hypothetical protein
VAPLSDTRLKPRERFFILNNRFYGTGRFSGRKSRCSETNIPHNRVDLPPLVSIEATRVCIPTGNSEMLLAAVYNSPGNAWIYADITELLSFRHKSLLAGDLNAKHSLRNRAVFNPLPAKFSVPYYEIIYMKNLSIWKVAASILDEVTDCFQFI